MNREGMQDEEAYTDFIAYFPDAPTERGIKHIRELIKAKKAGYHAESIREVRRAL